jgi:NADPH2:quinone reductase
MKAVVCREWGSPDVLRLDEVARPPLRPHEARIRVRACGVNFADALIVAGKYQRKPELPFVPGFEAAGDVIEVGGAVEHLHIGERVFAYLRLGGGYAEEAVADAATLVAIPAAMDWVTAGGFPIAYSTSHYALVHRARLRAGETLLVLGAAGGVGLTAVEIGKQLGARVIAAARGPDRLAVARQHGADELIDYQCDSIRDRVRELTAGRGADVVFDPIGGDAFDAALRAVNWGARMLLIGFAAGRIQSVPANLVLVKGISIVGVDRGAESLRDPGLIADGFAELLRWWEAGRLMPHVGRTFPLAEAGAAIEALLSRRYAGKIVLET